MEKNEQMLGNWPKNQRVSKVEIAYKMNEISCLRAFFHLGCFTHHLLTIALSQLREIVNMVNSNAPVNMGP